MQILTDKKIKEVFSNIPNLETERLLLRRIELSDAQDMYEYSCDKELTKYLTWASHTSLSETTRYIRLLEKKYMKGDFWDFGLVFKDTGKFIGTCGFTSFDKDTNSAEIGYVISPEYQRRGLAPEACRAVMKFGFAVFDLDYFAARFIDGNEASRKVMEKLGMEFETTYKNSFFIRNEYRTVHEYKITKKKFFETNS